MREWFICSCSNTLYLLWWWLISRRRGLLGRLMVNSCMLVGGCRDWFFMRAPYRTLDRQRFGMRMVGMLLALPPPAFSLCGFMPVCLKLTTGFSHWWTPAVSVWGLLLPWLMADPRLCKLSLQLIFVMHSLSTTVALSWSTTIAPWINCPHASEDLFYSSR